VTDTTDKETNERTNERTSSVSYMEFDTNAAFTSRFLQKKMLNNT